MVIENPLLPDKKIDLFATKLTTSCSKQIIFDFRCVNHSLIRTGNVVQIYMKGK